MGTCGRPPSLCRDAEKLNCCPLWPFAEQHDSFLINPSEMFTNKTRHITQENKFEARRPTILPFRYQIKQ